MAKRIDSNPFKHSVIAMLAASLLYAVAVGLIFAHHRFFFRDSYFGTRGDPQLYMWLLSWWPYAITHHLNPFITHMVWAPDGVNLTWTTSMPALALVAWPITAIWGPIQSFNVVTSVAPVLAASFAFILCHKLTGKFLPSAIGGWLFGFSAYHIGQLMGHLPLDFTACIPALTWLAVMRYRGEIGAPKFLAGCTILLTFQFGTSTEIFATATLFGLIGLILAFSLRSFDTGRLVQVTFGLGYSYIACFIVVSPYLYYMIRESHAVPQLIQPANVYVADVLNYLVPTQTMAVNGAWAASIAKHFTGNDPENGAYLGLPLLMIITAFAATFWRNAWARFLLLLFLVLVLCSFGPYLHFKGRSLCPMPWWLGEKLPLIRQALPVRFSLYTSLLATIMTALWLASLSREQSMKGYMLALLAMLMLIPDILGRRSYWFTDLWNLHTPVFFSQGEYKQVLKPGDNVIVLPYGNKGYSMLWQTTSGMYFRMAGGYVTAYIPSTFAQWPVVQMFYSGKPASGVRNDLTNFCEAKDVRAIILAAHVSRKWDWALRAMGWERIEAGGVVIYRTHLENRLQ